VAGTAYTEKDIGIEMETSIGKVVGCGLNGDYPLSFSSIQYKG